MKKILACFLAIMLLLLMASCKESVASPTDDQFLKVPSKAELAIKFGITEKVIDETHMAYPQIKTKVSSDTAFADGEVIIIVYPFANKYNYSTDDFAEIDCVSVNTLMEYRPNKADPSRILLLKFNGDVKNTISVLQERADIYCVEPNYEMTLH